MDKSPHRNERKRTSRLTGKKCNQRKHYDSKISLPFPESIAKKYFNDKTIKDWQTTWTHWTKGRNKFKIINIVSSTFLGIQRSAAYFLSGHGSFPNFLRKIRKLPSERCKCDKGPGSVTHYIFGNCPLMPFHFQFNRNKTLRKNLQRILLDLKNYDKLNKNYNVPNKNYSFVNRTF